MKDCNLISHLIRSYGKVPHASNLSRVWTIMLLALIYLQFALQNLICTHASCCCATFYCMRERDVKSLCQSVLSALVDACMCIHVRVERGGEGVAALRVKISKAAHLRYARCMRWRDLFTWWLQSFSPVDTLHARF